MKEKKVNWLRLDPYQDTEEETPYRRCPHCNRFQFRKIRKHIQAPLITNQSYLDELAQKLFWENCRKIYDSYYERMQKGDVYDILYEECKYCRYRRE